jgi:hypothetical protein
MVTVVRRVRGDTEDVASAKCIVDDGEEDLKISICFRRSLTAHANRIFFMGADACWVMR